VSKQVIQVMVVLGIEVKEGMVKTGVSNIPTSKFESGNNQSFNIRSPGTNTISYAPPHLSSSRIHWSFSGPPDENGESRFHCISD
jgi:hypothetical protein